MLLFQQFENINMLVIQLKCNGSYMENWSFAYFNYSLNRYIIIHSSLSNTNPPHRTKEGRTGEENLEFCAACITFSMRTAALYSAKYTSNIKHFLQKTNYFSFSKLLNPKGVCLYPSNNLKIYMQNPAGGAHLDLSQVLQGTLRP